MNVPLLETIYIPTPPVSVVFHLSLSRQVALNLAAYRRARLRLSLLVFICHGTFDKHP
jgi:hypothetical protein